MGLGAAGPAGGRGWLPGLLVGGLPEGAGAGIEPDGSSGTEVESARAGGSVELEGAAAGSGVVHAATAKSTASAVAANPRRRAVFDPISFAPVWVCFSPAGGARTCETKTLP
ncbi:hypothetical protein GCM10010452_34880 [Crossiella cryophila]